MGTGAGRPRPVARAVKRTVDVLGALLTLTLLAPVYAGVAVAVRLRMGAPVLFRQARIGRDLVPFELLKFRTMRAPTAGEEALLSDADRITPLGRLLRRTSLDELPTVWNVLRGDMSVVGPRPLLDLHIELFGPDATDRWRVRPGITGLAQVDGRQGLTFRQRLERDLAYARGWSFPGDVGIVLRTVAGVVTGGGVVTGLEDAVDDVGLADAIRARARVEHGSTLQPHGPVGAEGDGGGGAGSGGGARSTWVPDGAVRFATAREALVAGLAARGVRRVHLPTFGCHDVTRALRGPFEVVLHPDRPGGPPSRVELADDEAAVVVTTFGLPPRWTVVGGTLVVDVTHGPWDAVAAGAAPTDAAGRAADLVVASLRKTLPVPDGALLWTPTGGALPPEPGPDPAHDAGAERLDASLTAKAAWLAGADGPGVVPKDGPRGWLRSLQAGEAALLGLDARPRAASRVTRERVPALDVAARWARREANTAAFATAFAAALTDASADARGDLAGAVSLLPAPALVVLVLQDRALREALRTALVAERVYAAVLWPTDGEDVTDEDRDLADRILVLHADARYDTAAMTRVARLVVGTLGALVAGAGSAA